MDREQEGVGGWAGEGEARWEDELEGRGCTVVEEAPVKPRARSCLQSQMQSQVHLQPVGSQRKVTGRSVSTSLRAEACFSKLCDEETLEDSEGIWQLHSLPDILLLNPEPRKGAGE